MRQFSLVKLGPFTIHNQNFSFPNEGEYVEKLDLASLSEGDEFYFSYACVRRYVVEEIDKTSGHLKVIELFWNTQFNGLVAERSFITAQTIRRGSWLMFFNKPNSSSFSSVSISKFDPQPPIKVIYKNPPPA